MNNNFINKQRLYNLLLFVIIGLAATLRIYAYSVFRPLWRDECSLAINIYFNNFANLWDVLNYSQSAPPIFMCLCKILNIICPRYPEYTLRLFPLIAGLTSIFLFYLLTKKILNSKLAILFANFLFAINTQLIYFSHEFKQYSSDVMLMIGGILYFSELDVDKLSKKQLFLSSIIMAILPLISLPSFFVIGAWILKQIYCKGNLFRLIKFSIPMFCINTWYFFHILYPTSKTFHKWYGFIWNDGFIKLDIYSTYMLLKHNFSFFFEQIQYPFIPIIITIIGCIYLIKRFNSFDKFIFNIICLVIFASYLAIYPFYQRAALYFIPIVIILTTLPLAEIKQKYLKFLFFILFCSMFVGFTNYKIIVKSYEYPNLALEVLKENIRDDDYIIYNDCSNSEFFVYSKIYNFNYENYQYSQMDVDYNKSENDEYKDEFIKSLDSLSPNKRYWFYFPYDSIHKPIIPTLKEWGHKNGKIIIEKNFLYNSYLLYLQL